MFERFYDLWLSETPYFDYLQDDLGNRPFKQPHYLYRVLDENHKLLYVGETRKLTERMSYHKGNSSWFSKASSILIYGCNSRREALALEEAAIHKETPQFNKNCQLPTKKRGSSGIKNPVSKEPRYCAHCECLLDPVWARANQKYCDESCKAAYWYQKKYKTSYDIRYKKFKKQWEISPSGKRAELPIREWLKLPKDWR